MSLVTQIGGGYGENHRQVFQLKQKLQCININATHPIGDGSIYIKENLESSDSSLWHPYELYLDYYSSIASSDFHIVYNELHTTKGYLTNDMAREILYAMLKRKPIILLYPPTFPPSVELFSRKLIEHYLNQIIVCDLVTLDNTDVKRLLREVAKSPATYVLTNSDSQIIQGMVREYFRRLVTSLHVGPKKHQAISEGQSCVFTKFIGKLEIEPRDQTHMSLGHFTAAHPAKGFSIALDQAPESSDAVVTQITPRDTAKHYELILHIANYSDKPVSTEVWGMK